MSEQPEQRDPSLRFVGRLQVTAGILIILVVGPCTLFAGGSLFSMYGFQPEFVIMTVMFGGLPLLVGVLLILSGRERLRRSSIKSNPPDDRA